MYKLLLAGLLSTTATVALANVYTPITNNSCPSGKYGPSCNYVLAFDEEFVNGQPLEHGKICGSQTTMGRPRLRLRATRRNWNATISTICRLGLKLSNSI